MIHFFFLLVDGFLKLQHVLVFVGTRHETEPADKNRSQMFVVDDAQSLLKEEGADQFDSPPQCPLLRVEVTAISKAL